MRKKSVISQYAKDRRMRKKVLYFNTQNEIYARVRESKTQNTHIEGIEFFALQILITCRQFQPFRCQNYRNLGTPFSTMPFLTFNINLEKEQLKIQRAAVAQQIEMRFFAMNSKEYS